MKRFSLIFAVTALFSLGVQAQGVFNVRINEVLVVNENDVIDDYAAKGSWIELFNTGQEVVDLSSCYLGVRYADKYDSEGNKLIKKYFIPNDPKMHMGALDYRLFFCEGTDTKGAFYTNFTLEGENVDMIILYNANGKDVLSVFQFPENYEPVADVSLGIIGHDEPQSYIFPEFSRKEKKQWAKEGIALEGDFMLDMIAERLKYQPQAMAITTPNSTNEKMAEIPKHERFRRNDPTGVVMMLTAMAVVFSALILIFLVIKLFGMIMMARTKRAEKKKETPAVVAQPTSANYSEEVVAAIGVALKLFQEDLHINEATVITINRVGRVYSPWSSKIHGITEIPEKKNR